MADEDGTPSVPATDAPTPDSQDTNALLREMLAAQQQQRAEVAELREELAKAKTPPPPPSSTVLSDEDLQAQRASEIEKYQFYCPGCGRLTDRDRPCTGSGEAPHPSLEVVSTNELSPDSDPSKHTAAPGVRP